MLSISLIGDLGEPTTAKAMAASTTATNTARTAGRDGRTRDRDGDRNHRHSAGRRWPAAGCPSPREEDVDVLISGSSAIGHVSSGSGPGLKTGRDWHRLGWGARRLHCFPSDDRAIQARTRLIYVRWTGLLALFGLEVAALTLRFDTKTLEGGPLWLEGLFGLLRVGFDVVVVGAAVVLLLQRKEIGGRNSIEANRAACP